MARIFVLAALLMCGNVLAAADVDHAAHAAATGPAAGDHATEVHMPYHHPNLPGDARWAGATTVLILGSFLLAAGVGVVTYSEPPVEDSAHASHDERHGHDAGHEAHH